jgi:outer membrane protein insertion porin family
VAEGELYSAADLNKSRDRLKRTGFFKEVDFTTSRGGTEEKINLDIKVEEAPTGAISFGVGYSSLENVVGSASISDRNLFGYGYQGVLKFSLGAETRNFRLSFTDPYFLGYPVSAGIDLYHERMEIFDTYSYKTTGGGLRFGKELTDKIRLDLMYKLEQIDVYDVEETASTYIKEQEGKKTTSAIAISPSIDTRDDYFNPRRGARHSLFIQNAGGILGGDNYFVKVTGETSWFFPLPLNSTLNLRAKAGLIAPYGGKKLPIYEKFFVGGIQTVRGFEYGRAGPIDERDEPSGAKKMVAFNVEWIFPLAREIGLRGALFFDVGKGFDKLRDESHMVVDLDTHRILTRPGKGLFPLKFGAGPGIRWFSPFGPIHIDIGFNLSPQKGEKRNVIEFTAGTIY